MIVLSIKTANVTSHAVKRDVACKAAMLLNVAHLIQNVFAKKLAVKPAAVFQRIAPTAAELVKHAIARRHAVLPSAVSKLHAKLIVHAKRVKSVIAANHAARPSAVQRQLEVLTDSYISLCFEFIFCLIFSISIKFSPSILAHDRIKFFAIIIKN